MVFNNTNTCLTEKTVKIDTYELIGRLKVIIY